MSDAPTRVIVLNFTAKARGLAAAVADFFVGDRIELVVIGDGEAPRPSSPRLEVTTLRGDVEHGFDAYAERLRVEARIADASAVIVLPQSGAAEVDAHSRLTCVAIRRACGEGPMPTTVVAIEDPEASFEFAGLGVTTIFYPGFLRAALFAHACVDLPVFHFILGLLRGAYRVDTLPVPEHLKGSTFRDACRTLERGADGRPITLVGVFAEDPRGEGPAVMKINPSPAFALAGARSLLAIGERRA
ncbi:MAG: hypothetical protein R3B09_16125 [Nannocystaceae bacterium]